FSASAELVQLTVGVRSRPPRTASARIRKPMPERRSAIPTTTLNSPFRSAMHEVLRAVESAVSVTRCCGRRSRSAYPPHPWRPRPHHSYLSDRSGLLTQTVAHGRTVRYRNPVGSDFAKSAASRRLVETTVQLGRQVVCEVGDLPRVGGHSSK